MTEAERQLLISVSVAVSELAKQNHWPNVSAQIDDLLQIVAIEGDLNR
ncbi:hypothetical protein HYPP_02446 [Hyphomicrobium sp. ghe19]|nr:hypothetical protein HYPP_02446 [Hyphomicrobium sp. ghe19]